MDDFFQFNPIKDFFKMTKSLEIFENLKSENQRKNLEKELKKNLEICTNFINNTYIYVPFAACLISKFPYVKQMQIALDAIIKVFSAKNCTQKDLNNLIIHLIHEIPKPPTNKILNFFLPYNLTQVEIRNNLHRDIPYNSFNLNKIFEFFSSENFTLIIFLILFEQKILFICDNYNLLSEIILSFVSLIHPFEWVNILIPILSEELVRYLQCFRPFIMGIDENMLEYAKSYIEENDEIFFVYIKKDQVELFSNKKLKKCNKKNLYNDKEGLLPGLNEELYNEFKNEIGDLKKIWEKNKKNKKDKLFQDYKIMNKFRKSCIKLMAYIFGDFRKYLTYIDKIPIFNEESFVISRSVIYKKFYEEILNTHIFKYFLQISDYKISCFPYFDKLSIRFSNIRSHSHSINNSGNKIDNNKGKKNFIFFGEKDKKRTPSIIDNLFKLKGNDNTNTNSSNKANRSASTNSKLIKVEKNSDNVLEFFNEISNRNFLKKNTNNNNIEENSKHHNRNNSGFAFTNTLNNNNNNMNESSIRNSDSNSYENSDSNKNINNNNNENDNYIILPYFINSLLNSEISKIEFYIMEKIKSNNKNNKNFEKYLFTFLPFLHLK